MKRRAFLRATAAAGAAAWAVPLAGARRARASTQPNIIVILADDLGYGTLGCYGQQTLLTPNLDRMAAEGIRFTDGYSGAPICAPSRCSLLTGMHTGHARVRDNSFTTTGQEPELLSEDVTFAEVLRAAGYATGVFGKWGFGPDDCYVPYSFGVGPVELGNDEVGGPRGPLDQNVGHTSHPLQKGFDEFVGMVRHHHATEGYYPAYLWHGNERVLYPENDGDARATYAPDVYLSAALDFMRRNAGRPFAMLYTPQMAHWPNLIPSTDPYSDMPWTTELKRYAAQITLLDTHVGAIRAQLERLGIADDTLIVFSSDNGATEERALGSGEHSRYLGPSESFAGDFLWNTSGGLRARKHSLYDGGIRVPTIVWGPGIVRSDAATVAGRPWQTADLLPTFADFAGIAPPPDVDGVSIRGWITGGSDAEHPPLYWERPPYFGLNVDGSPNSGTTYAQAVRIGPWKGLRYPLSGTDPNTPDDQWRFELYDLGQDKGESREVSLLYPSVVAELTEAIHAMHAPQPYERAPWP